MMMKLPACDFVYGTALAAAVIFFLNSCARAESFQILGVRALAMGGAQVAIPEGGLVSYWNPGGLAFGNDIAMSVPVSVDMNSTRNVFKTINDAGGIPSSFAQTSTSPQVAATSELSLAEPGIGISAGVDAGVLTRVRQWAVSMNNFSELGVSPQLSADQQIATLFGGIPTSNETSTSSPAAIIARGVALSELSVGYGRQYPLPSSAGELGIGGNLKAMRADVGFARTTTTPGSYPGLRQWEDNFRASDSVSYRPSIDLGCLWKMPTYRPWQLGFLWRNINEPSFSAPGAGATIDGSHYQLNGQARVGVGYWPIPSVTLAADVDLSENPTLISEYKSREASLGAEWRYHCLALRGGLFANIDASESPQYSFGVAYEGRSLSLGLAAMAAFTRADIPTVDKSSPTAVQLALEVAYHFGQRPAQRADWNFVQLPEPDKRKPAVVTPTSTDNDDVNVVPTGEMISR